MTSLDVNDGGHTGDASAALAWIEDSELPTRDKIELRRFVDRFPSVTFYREDDARLDSYESADQITLPGWFRAYRSTLSGTEPYSRLRIDAFSFSGSPREDPGMEYYEVSPGYINEEIRDLLFDGTNIYLIGQWFGSDQSCLAIDLEQPDDTRIFEFAMEDLYDDEDEGRPLRESLTPVFASYAELLGHVVEVRLPGGEVITALD